MQMTRAQAQYKDRLFSFIFGSEEHKDWTLSLYNAVNGSSYDNPDSITITTIRDALYLGMHNDVSFIISNEMNMFEQQSSFNPNMPLRMLQYAGSLYEKDITLREKNKYSKTIVPLPVPRLLVFYNGRDEMPDETILNLYDAFPPEHREDADIAVRVRMINVNRGHNRRAMAVCQPLAEYAWIVDRIRSLEADGNLEEAIGTAIDEMPDHFCIKRYLEAHRAEVKTMLLTEYNEARQMDLFYRDGLEKGEMVGRREGRLEGRREGRLEGQAMISSLMERLLSAGRIEEAKRAASDPEYREQLLRELSMN